MAKVNEKGLRCEPVHIDSHNWFYEERKHFVFVHECLDKQGNLLQTDIINVPWKLLLESVRRKYGEIK
jgi:hypothetical protein